MLKRIYANAATCMTLIGGLALKEDQIVATSGAVTKGIHWEIKQLDRTLTRQRTGQ
jgi:hypothetical protein